MLKGGYPYISNNRHPVEWTEKDYYQFAKDAIVHWRGEDVTFKDIDVHFSYPDDVTLSEVYDIEFTTFMKNLCLYLSDRLGMANSMEIRSPLLDYKLVDFVSRLPQDMKYDGTPKGFYKWCLRGIVPDYILDTPKRGFEPPFEFIRQMCSDYNYIYIQSSHVFFNSMLADRIIDSLLNV